jgi:hypothetical protein
MYRKKYEEVTPRICDCMVEPRGDVYCSVCVIRADKKQGRPQLE